MSINDQSKQPDEPKDLNPEETSRGTRESYSNGNITTGSVQGTGIAIGPHASAHVEQHGLSGDEIANLFSEVYKKIDARPLDPNVGKPEIVAQVQQIEQEVAKPEPNVNKLERWLRTLADMAPDIFEVAAAAAAGPVTAARTIIQKVVDKVREEKGAA